MIPAGWHLAVATNPPPLENVSVLYLDYAKEQETLGCMWMGVDKCWRWGESGEVVTGVKVIYWMQPVMPSGYAVALPHSMEEMVYSHA